MTINSHNTPIYFNSYSWHNMFGFQLEITSHAKSHKKQSKELKETSDQIEMLHRCWNYQTEF